MTPLAGRLSNQVAGHGRSQKRRELRLLSTGVVSETSTMVTVYDISTTGLMIETAADLAVGEVITVRLPGAISSDARVVWRRDNRFGCEFVVPLKSSELSTTLWYGLFGNRTAQDSPVEELPIGIDPSLEDLHTWKETFDKASETTGYQLIGFRRDDNGKIVAIVSKMQ